MQEESDESPLFNISWNSIQVFKRNQWIILGDTLGSSWKERPVWFEGLHFHTQQEAQVYLSLYTRVSLSDAGDPRNICISLCIHIYIYIEKTGLVYRPIWNLRKLKKLYLPPNTHVASFAWPTWTESSAWILLSIAESIPSTNLDTEVDDF